MESELTNHNSCILPRDLAQLATFTRNIIWVHEFLAETVNYNKGIENFLVHYVVASERKR